MKSRSEKFFKNKSPLIRRLYLLTLALIIILGGGIYFVQADVVVPPPGKLAQVGPIHTDNGFPEWYKDSKGLRLQLCLDQNDPLCALAPEEIPDPTKPISFKDGNFPHEAFYQLAGSEMETGTGGDAVATFALEAAFANEMAIEGDQIVFGRVRLRVEGLTIGQEYTITHPYGVDKFIAEDDGKGAGEIRFVEDIGVNGGFQGALKSRIGTFLKWDPTVTPAAPIGYIGDPNVDHPVVGSLLTDEKTGLPQNFFRIEGPGIGDGSPNACRNENGSADSNCIETNLFSLMGKIATNTGVDIQQATYSRTSEAGGTIDVYATTYDDDEVEPENIEVTGVTGNVETLESMLGANGQYYARVSFTGATAPRIKITNKGDNPQTSKEITPVDQITGTAVYNTNDQTLTVTASSSDKVGPPVLSVDNYNETLVYNADLGVGTVTINGVDYTPPTITVVSSAGGRASIPVTVTGDSFTVPVVANVGDDQQVQTGATVTLDASNSTGVVRSYLWTQVSGTPVTLSSNITKTVQFTAPDTAGELVFELTVTGLNGIPSKATVTVTVTDSIEVPDGNPVAVATVAKRDVAPGEAVILDGTGSSGSIVSYAWEQLDGTPVELTGGDTSKSTFTAPEVTGPLTFKLTVTDSNGITASSNVTVNVVNNPNPNPDPALLEANAGPDQEGVQQNTTVQLNGLGSINATEFKWSQVSGPNVNIINGNTAEPTFTTPKQAATFEFKLTVKGSGTEVKEDTVIITTAPDQPRVTSAQYRSKDREYRISGTTNVAGPDVKITIKIGTQVIATVDVDNFGGWGYRGSGPAPGNLTDITIESTSGGVMTSALGVK